MHWRRFGAIILHLSPPPTPVALAAARSKAVAMLLLIYCLMHFPLFVGIQWLSLFCYASLCVRSSFVIILNVKRELVALLLLSYGCLVTVNVLLLFLMVPWVGLQCVIVIFPDHTHLRFPSCTSHENKK